MPEGGGDYIALGVTDLRGKRGELAALGVGSFPVWEGLAGACRGGAWVSVRRACLGSVCGVCGLN